MIEDRRRGVVVRVIVDKQSITGCTRNMAACCSQLRSFGVEIRTLVGRSLGEVYGSRLRGLVGAQHSKSLRSDCSLVVGSTNFTRSSRCNHELGVEVSLNDAGLEAMLLRFTGLWSEAAPRSHD